MTRVAVLLLLALLPACSRTPEPATDRPVGPSASSPPSLSPSPSPSPSALAPAPSPSPAEATGTPADATGQPSGAPLTVTAVRAAGQRGYDRVVLELHGRAAGAPGWQVGYVVDPVADGSGAAVPVQGSAYLRVVVTGVGYPFDTGQTEASGDLRPRDTAVVREVALQGTDEGRFTAFVGLTRRVPFRVTRLADPARVVVDLG